MNSIFSNLKSFFLCKRTPLEEKVQKKYNKFKDRNLHKLFLILDVYLYIYMVIKLTEFTIKSCLFKLFLTNPDFATTRKFLMGFTAFNLVVFPFIFYKVHYKAKKFSDKKTFLFNIFALIYVFENLIHGCSLNKLQSGVFVYGVQTAITNMFFLYLYKQKKYYLLQIFFSFVYLEIRIAMTQFYFEPMVILFVISFLWGIISFSYKNWEFSVFKELYLNSKQNSSWKNFANMLPEGVAIMQNKKVSFSNSTVKNIFKLEGEQEITEKILKLKQGENIGDIKIDEIGKKIEKKEENYITFEEYLDCQEANTTMSHFDNSTIILHNKIPFYKRFLKWLFPSKYTPIQYQSHISSPKKSAKLTRSSQKNIEILQKNFKQNTFLCEYLDRKLIVKLAKLYLTNVEDSYFLLLNDETESIKYSVVKETHEYKNLVFTSFSHELRTPLNCILIMIQIILEDNSISLEVKESFLKPILYSSKILLNLVNDILDFSLIISQQLVLNISEMNIVELAKEVLEYFSFQANNKNIALNILVYDDLQENIKSDARRIAQILTHFISNAIKFTEKVDSGIGMNVEEANRLRQKLNQSAFSLTKKISGASSGVGMGLSLCQCLIEKLSVNKNIGLDFKTVENKGTSFYFEIKDFDEDIKLLDVKSLRIVSETKKYVINSEKLTNGIEVLKISRQVKNNDNVEFCKIQKNSKSKSASLSKEDEHFYYEAEFKTSPNDFLLTEEYIEYFILNNLSRNDITLKEVDSIDKSVKSKVKRQLESNHKEKILIENNNSELIVERVPLIQLSPKKTKCEHYPALIVDDDEFNIYSLKLLLKQKKVNTKEAKNGREAIDVVYEEKNLRKNCNSCQEGFDIIFMDVNMPVMDGIDATKELRKKMKENEIKNCAIVACTAYISEDIRIKCFEAGVNEFLTKPLTPDKIGDMIKKYVN